VNGSEPLLAVAGGSPRTLGAAMEKLIVTVCDDVAPTRTSECAPAAKSVGTVKGYATAPADVAVAGISVSGTECTVADTFSPAVNPPACTVTTCPGASVGSAPSAVPAESMTVADPLSVDVIEYGTAALCEAAKAVRSVGVKIATKLWLDPIASVVVETVADPPTTVCVAPICTLPPSQKFTVPAGVQVAVHVTVAVSCTTAPVAAVVVGLTASAVVVATAVDDAFTW
jgi:hypothetical protein